MRRFKNKRTFLIVMIVCAVIAVGCVGILTWMHLEQKRVEAVLENARMEPDVISKTENPPWAQNPEPDVNANPEIGTPDKPVSSVETPSDPEMTVAEKPPEPVEVPYDFEYLQGINSDIYAWLKLNCTGQEFPVLDNQDDPDYYLRRDIYKNYSSNGSLYTQSVYNSRDFVDPCTIIYGHTMTSGIMFGSLEQYTVSRNLDDESDAGNYFTLYTTSKILTYRIACTGVYSTNHVLYYNNFSTEDGFNFFFNELKTYTDTTNFSETFTPKFGDNLVILSTCHQPNDYYRYLVVGVLVNQQGN